MGALGDSWGGLGRSGGDLKATPTSIPKRGRTLRANNSHLGTDLGRFWVVLGCARGAFLLIFYWFLYYFVEIDLTSFQDAFWSESGAT